MVAAKQVPAEVLAELANEFAAGLPARAAVLREALDELEQGASADAAQRLRLTAHALAGTASAFGARELTPHAERLESLGKGWQEQHGAAADADLARARDILAQLIATMDIVAERLRTR
jgi:HPt (histidine-containing phosphotransfer) domain-containing protein